MSSSILTYQYIYFFFFFNDTATTEIYTLSLHDALPILRRWACPLLIPVCPILSVWHFISMEARLTATPNVVQRDRKSTRLNSSHGYISYAVFCLKKKKKKLEYMHN